MNVKTDVEHDDVMHPAHYADKQVEVIDYIYDTLTTEEFAGYCMGNVLKYVSRWRKKGGIQDLEKADVYLQWGISALHRANEIAKQKKEEFFDEVDDDEEQH